MTDKKWKTEKCGTNTPPEVIPKNPSMIKNQTEIGIDINGVIKKFKDGFCLVIENDEISLRENDFTKYRIVLGEKTNELLEFVKENYKQLQLEKEKVKELEKLLKERMEDLCDACGAGSLYPMPCQIYKQVLEEIKPVLKYYADSKIGNKNPDGTFTLSSPHKSPITGQQEIIFTYDPRPAQEALKNILRCEKDENK